MSTASRLSLLTDVVPVDELELVDEPVLESDVVVLSDEVLLGGGPGGGGGGVVEPVVPHSEPSRAEANVSKACASLSSVVELELDPVAAVELVESLVEAVVTSDVDEDEPVTPGGGPGGGPPCCEDDPESPEFASCARNAAKAPPICAALAFVLSTVEVDAVDVDDESAPDEVDENWPEALLSAACACFRSCRRRLLFAELETDIDTSVLHVGGEPRAGPMKITMRLRSA